MELNNEWDFVEKYYPNYYKSNDIAFNDDLHCIVDDEWQESEAKTRLVAEYKSNYGDKWLEQVKIDRDVSDRDIFEASIEGYIKTLKQTQSWK